MNNIKNISLFSNERLCEIIICARYLGSMREEAIQCMQELAIRRGNGDIFDYENYINQKIINLPDFKFDIKQKMNLGIDLSFLKSFK